MGEQTKGQVGSETNTLGGRRNSRILTQRDLTVGTKAQYNEHHSTEEFGGGLPDDLTTFTVIKVVDCDENTANNVPESGPSVRVSSDKLARRDGRLPEVAPTL